MFGIDVSRWQGSPDWAAVAAAGVGFAYINASNQTPDVQFTGAGRAGLAVGLYYRARADQAPEAAADEIAGHGNRLGAAAPGRLPPCLDLEDGDGDRSGWAAAFIARLRARTGTRRVMLYSGAWFFRHRIGEDWMDDDVALWIADYSAPSGQPSYLSERVAIHQYSSTGRVPGITGDVDLNHPIWPLARIIGQDVGMRIISRSEWGAVHGDGKGPAPVPASEVWLHHSVTTAPDLVPPFDDDYAAIRALERIGASRFGTEYGISYTFVITPAGLIFEGHAVGQLGAHTANHNRVGRGICLVGDYTTRAPTPAQMDAVVWLLREGKARGWWTTARLTGGHRDVKATACPGDRAYAAIPEINRRAALAVPPTNGDDVTPDDIKAAVRAVLNEPLTRGGDHQAGTTTFVAVASWTDEAWYTLRAKTDEAITAVAALSAKVSELSAVDVASVVDPDALAAKVADLLAARLRE